MRPLQINLLYKRKVKSTEKGMAVIESIPVLFMVVVLFNFSLGFFGAVHSGILNSIASYNYTLETFRFRSNLVYFRPGGGDVNYAKSQNRVHGTVQDGSEDSGDSSVVNSKQWPATMRGITFNYKNGDPNRDLSSIQDGRIKTSAPPDNPIMHAYKTVADGSIIWGIKSKSVPTASDTAQTPRIWIKTVYGICLNADCK